MSKPTGRGNPPEASRFTKGRSGNPKGRPKRAEKPAGSAFDILIGKTLTVTHGGEPREVKVEEALQHRTYQQAIAGNRSARRTVLTMIARRETHLAAGRPAPGPRFEKRSEIDPENADAALLLLGIADRDPQRLGDRFDGEQLLLEPWAAQMALGRRRGGRKLTDRERQDILRSTRDPGSLRWPRGSGA
jgi:hypothetical protein